MSVASIIDNIDARDGGDDYFMKNCRKIREYRQNGYNQNTNLIITWEDDISEQYMIDDIIERRIIL